MDQGRNGRRTFHGVGQPDMQGKLRRFAHSADEQADTDDGSCIQQATAIIRVESVCGNNSTLTVHEVTCEVYQAAHDFAAANVGNPCMYYTFIDINGNSVSGYLRSLVGC